MAKVADIKVKSITPAICKDTIRNERKCVECRIGYKNSALARIIHFKKYWYDYGRLQALICKLVHTHTHTQEDTTQPAVVSEWQQVT